MHIESAIDFVLFCRINNRVSVHDSAVSVFCIVCCCCFLFLFLFCVIKNSPKAIAIYHQMLLMGIFYRQTGNVLWMNLSRVRVAKSVITDCLSMWIHFLSFVLSVNPLKNKLFRKKKSKQQNLLHAVLNLYVDVKIVRRLLIWHFSKFEIRENCYSSNR